MNQALGIQRFSISLWEVHFCQQANRRAGDRHVAWQVLWWAVVWVPSFTEKGCQSWVDQ